MRRLLVIVLAATATAACVVAAGLAVARHESLTVELSAFFALLFGLVFALAIGFQTRRADQPVPDAVAQERLDADLLYDFASARLETQKSLIDSLDAKLGVIFSVGSAEIGALAAFLALGPPQSAGDTLVLSVSFISYVVLAGVAARGLWSRRWFMGPVMAELVEAYRSLDKGVVKLAVARSLIDAFDENEGPAEAKASAVRIVIVALIVQTMGLIAAVALTRPA